MNDTLDSLAAAAETLISEVLAGNLSRQMEDDKIAEASSKVAELIAEIPNPPGIYADILADANVTAGLLTEAANASGSLRISKLEAALAKLNHVRSLIANL